MVRCYSHPAVMRYPGAGRVVISFDTRPLTALKLVSPILRSRGKNPLLIVSFATAFSPPRHEGFGPVMLQTVDYAMHDRKTHDLPEHTLLYHDVNV